MIDFTVNVEIDRLKSYTSKCVRVVKVVASVYECLVVIIEL